MPNLKNHRDNPGHPEVTYESPRWRRRVRATVLGTVLGTALLVSWPGAAAATDPGLAGEKLVADYNARNFGSPGWRRVRLDLKSGQLTTRSFTVVNLWRQEGGQVSTVFVLERPENLRGTNYLLVEEARELAAMKVYLHLPAGKRRVLAIEPSQFDEGLLGSDFGYRDLRMQIPTAGYHFRAVGSEELLGRQVRIVEAKPSTSQTRRHSWARTHYYLTEDPPLLLGADHWTVTGGRLELTKRMRVEGVREVDGAWTETRIVMSSTDGHSSILTLSHFQPSITHLGPGLFTPQVLPTLAERLPEGLTSPRLAREIQGAP